MGEHGRMQADFSPVRSEGSRARTGPNISSEQIHMKKSDLGRGALAIDDGLRSHGSALDHEIAHGMKVAFGHDFSNVRVHSDVEAAKAAKAVGARAFTVGNHIVFGAGEYSPATTVGQTLIEHEMLHSMLNKGNVGLVGFWGEEDHKKITSKVASEVVGDQIFAFQLASNSGLMDVKGKRIFGTLPRFLPQYLGAKAGIDVYPLDPTGIVKKGEGPDHGEDGNYMNPDKNAAKAANKSVQDKYLRVAVNHHKSMEAKRRSGEPVHKIGSASEKMFEALGDACHVAQDRGSHGEGTKGMGHDDPRTKTGWNPDSPTENAAGYSEAVQNTRSLMEDFVRLRSG